MPASAFLQRIATATPTHDVHGAFVAFAHGMLQDERPQALFLRMAARAGIESRYSVLSVTGASQAAPDAYALYRIGHFPSTAERMRLYQRLASPLMKTALDRLHLSPAERTRIRHVLVTSCTGLYAPGLDFQAIEHLGLHRECERTMIGFMGCYAAVNALKQARHIVRSHPEESVLVINLELCTLHLQETQDLNEVLSFLVFGDGCAAALVGSQPVGCEMDSFQALHLEGTENLITWNVGDNGFDMVLSGQVPAAIGRALSENIALQKELRDVSLFAIHPGGRSVLDAVQDGLALHAGALNTSREVLRTCGNMSSATVMFVLQRILQIAQPGQRGIAMSFGPGLTAETMRFHAAG